MNQWTFTPSYFGFFIILILLIYLLFDKKGRKTYSEKNFQICLYSTLVSISVNIASMYCREYCQFTHLWVNYTLQVLDYLCGALASLFIFRYLIIVLHENYNDEKHLRLSFTLLYLTTALYLIPLALNYWTGWIFSFDPTGRYIRGTCANPLFYLYLVHYAFMFSGFFHYRKTISRMLDRIMVLGVFTAIILIILQVVFPEVMLSSMGAALVVLIIFISSQQSQSNTDPLTGAYNRSALYYSLESAIREERSFYLLSIEIKAFNRINKQHGQRNGDLFLRAIVQNLQSETGSAVYRMIGASFVLLVFDAQNGYQDILGRIRTLFNQPWQVAGIQSSLQASFVDIVYTNEINQKADRLISWLEYATRYAKETSQIEYLHFDKTLSDKFDRHEELVVLMKTAVKNKKFRLCLQPIFSIKDNHYVGAEALIRLNTETGIPVSPAEFIPIAEETNLINDIGYYVIEEVCQFLQNPTIPSDWFIAINISAQQFVKDDFVTSYVKLLDTYKIDPRRIRFELTEYVMLNYEKIATENMAELKKIGTSIFLDDFGTGYSNLFVLSSLPISVVKIDKSLTWNIDKPSVFAMVSTFIAGIQKAGIAVLVEGIEKEEQKTTFEQLGTEMLQGYYFSKPLELEDFIKQFGG